MTDINKHPQYGESLSIWEMVRDATKPNGVKDAGVKYLPRAENHDDGDRNSSRYAKYKDRAVFYGFSQETVSGLLGLAFRQGVSIETEGKDYIEDDIDGDGVGLEQQAKSAAKNVIKYGRAGLLVDFPPSEGSITIEQQRNNGLVATVNLYDTFHIKNWATKRVGSKTILSMVVLTEIEYRADENELTVEEVTVERRLTLDNDGHYMVEIREDEQTIETYYPRDFAGQMINEIPFYFIGSVNNDSNVDDSPLFPIADMNVAHYRNSADYENSVWQCGQPQPWGTGLTQNWVDQNLKNFSFGAGVMLTGPDGASFGLMQVEPNTMAYEAMKYKQEAMIAMGAKLINAQVSFSSATEAIIASASENSRLQTIIDNVENAYQAALEGLTLFMGGDVPIFTIDTDLSAVMTDPQMAQMMVGAWQSGLVASADARGYLRKVGAVERTDEEIEEEIENVGVDLDGE
jgi:Domain of unknown function (DUF4055)